MKFDMKVEKSKLVFDFEDLGGVATGLEIVPAAVW
jgi:hypothetical protein